MGGKMKLVVSSYQTNGNSIGLYEITNGIYRCLSSSDILALSFLVSDGKYVYTYEKSDWLTLCSYTITNNQLTLLDKITLPIKSATHLCLSLKNKALFGCSYSDGAYFYVSIANGKFIKVNECRRQGVDDILSRCHCVFLNKEETILGIVNIALDAIYFYKINEDNLELIDLIKLPSGCGPRHAIYNQDDSLIYVMTEYSNEVIVINMQTKEIIEKISTIPNYQGESSGATLFFTKDYQYLYASNRGEDSIAKFKVLTNGKLIYQNSFSCFGKHPRHMILSNDGKYIISCNKDSNNLVLIDLNTEKAVLNIPYKCFLCE